MNPEGQPTQEPTEGRLDPNNLFVDAETEVTGDKELDSKEFENGDTNTDEKKELPN